MAAPAILVKEFRGGLLECTHYGNIVICDEQGLKHGVGDTDFVSFYRSASKPIQCLPVYQMGLDVKYGLTDEETSIMAGSLSCNPSQVEIMKSIMQKADIKYETLVMLPCYSMYHDYEIDSRLAGLPPSKLFHNCMGKHLALILIQRELGGPEADYYKMESLVQQKVLDYIAYFADMPRDSIGIGIDGCGVPVFAVPMQNMARSWLKLAAPDLIDDPAIREATIRRVAITAKYPETMQDARALCGLLNSDPNIIAKSGAQGVYAFGLKKERLGVSIKLCEGSNDYNGLIVARMLELIGYSNRDTIEALHKRYTPDVINATGAVVGEKKAVFDWA